MSGVGIVICHLSFVICHLSFEYRGEGSKNLLVIGSRSVGTASLAKNQEQLPTLASIARLG